MSTTSMPAATDQQARKRRVLELAAAGVKETMARQDGVEPFSISTIERHGVRSRLQLDRASGMLPLKHIRPDPDQPRQVDTAVQNFHDLVSSVSEHGILQPITVRYVEDGDYFQLVTGERRYRAALAAGLQEVPAIVKDLDDTTKAIQQLEENIQRQDLNPIEEAAAVRRLMEAKGYTQRKVAEKIHKTESYVSELLAIDGRLTSQEKAGLVKLRPAKVPGKTLIYAALRARDPQMRHAILFGRATGKGITRSHLRAVLGSKKRRHVAVRGYSKQIEIKDVGATVTVAFASRPYAEEADVLRALQTACRLIRGKHR